jgi:AcrR family transcriptional regulator
MSDRTKRKATGVREQKIRETRLRIAQVGLRLFDVQGYDATTLEAVAAEAEISPRTLYHYFRTKYDILMFFHDGNFVTDIEPTIVEGANGQPPFQLARDSLLKLVPKYETDSMVVTDRIWNSTEGLRTQKQLTFLKIEAAVMRGLTRIWPDPSLSTKLSMISALSAGAIRVAQQIGLREKEHRSLQDRLRECFDAIEAADFVPAPLAVAARLQA